jgi:hypothetical protein
MNHSTNFDRNDTGILSLADLFPQDRLPRRAEAKRWLRPGSTPPPAEHESRVPAPSFSDPKARP